MVKKQICHLFLQLEKLRHGGQGAHFQDNRDMSQSLAKLVIPKTLASQNLVTHLHTCVGPLGEAPTCLIKAEMEN